MWGNLRRRLCMCFGLLLLSAVGRAQGGKNPILLHPDPFITPHPVEGKYLLLATAFENISIWSGPTVPAAATDRTVVFKAPPEMTELWSPTIWQVDDRWWIYFTAREQGREHAIYALESNTADPLGTYSLRGQVDVGRPAIDPSVMTIDGVRYLMYAALEDGANRIHMVRLADAMHVTGKDGTIMKPKYPWEKGAGSSRNYPIVEGPTALYHEDETFLVYSGSDTASPVYCLGLLRYKGGDPLNSRHWQREKRPVFSAVPANGIYGPGRGTFTEAADGTDWMLYAAKNTDVPTMAGRAIRAQRFTWDAAGMPVFGVPEKDGTVAGQ